MLGRLLGVKDPQGSVWAYTYDMRGLRPAANDPDLGNSWIYTYDDNGRLRTQKDNRNLVTTMGYDPLSRVAQKTANRPGGGNDVIVNTYDEVRSGYANIGQLTSATKAANGSTVASQTFNHSSEGILKSQGWTIDGGTYSIALGLALGGEVLWKVYSDGDTIGTASNNFQYDAAGRLYSVPSLVNSTNYRADGQTTSIGYFNNVVTSFSYKPERAWLTQITTNGPGGQIRSWNYSDRDFVGRIKSISSNNHPEESWTYTYDDLDRLLTATNVGNSSYSRSYAFSLNGNMTYNSGVGNYTYPGPTAPRPHAPLTAGGASYTYDANGNTTNDGARTFTWDAENKLGTSVLSGATTTYTYAPDGTRIKKSSTAGTFYTFGPDFEFAGGVYSKYPIPDVVKVGSTLSWLIRDHSQSIRLITSSSGAVTQSTVNGPYGTRRRR